MVRRTRLAFRADHVPLPGRQALGRAPCMARCDLGFVRSYLFKDGNLFMSLMADGGIYEWRPRRN
jgi:hypothetical protein